MTRRANLLLRAFHVLSMVESILFKHKSFHLYNNLLLLLSCFYRQGNEGLETVHNVSAMRWGLALNWTLAWPDASADTEQDPSLNLWGPLSPAPQCLFSPSEDILPAYTWYSKCYSPRWQIKLFSKLEHLQSVLCVAHSVAQRTL